MLVTLGSGAVSFMLLFVVPTFQKTYEESGAKLIKNVKVDANNYGLYVYRPKADLASIQNANITNNKYYGLYIYEGKVRFTNDSSSNVKLANNGYGIVGYKSDLTLDGVSLTGSKYYGILSYYGKLLVKDSKLFKNGNSLYSYYNDTSVVNSQIYDNTGWGMMAYGNAVKMDRSQIRNNNYGLYLQGLTDKKLDFSRSQIKDNKYYGIYARQCTLNFNNSTKSDYQLINNGYGVAAYQSTLKFDKWTLEKSKYYGLISWYSDIYMKDTAVRENGNGIYAYQNTSTVLEDCDVYKNTSWAFQSYYKPVTMKGTKIRDNNYGVYLYGMDDGKIRFQDTQIYNTKYYGVYVNKSKINFTKDTADKWQTKNNGYGFCVVSSTAHFEKWPVKGSKYYGLLSYYSDLSMNGSEVTENGNGLYLYRNKSVNISNTKIHKNTSWGVLSYYAGWNFKNVEIAENNYGLHAHTVTSDQIKMSDSVIRDNKYYGIYGYNSKLKFVKEDKWSLKNNGYGIQGYNSDITVDGFDITGSKYYGLLSYYGKLRINEAKITGNGNGLYLYKNKDVVVEDTEITKNSGWGMLTYWGGWKLKNVKCDENGHGLHAYKITNADVSMEDVSFSNNRTYGIYARSSTLQFDEKTAKRVTVAKNGYGYTSYQSNLNFKNYDIKENRSYGVVSYYSNLTFDNTNVSGNNRGVYSYRDTSVRVANSKLTGNKDWGMLSYFSPVSISNSSLSNNRHGLYLYQVPDGKAVLKNVDIANNAYHGLYLNATNMTMDGSTNDKFRVVNNGYQITANQSKLAMSDYTITGGKYYGLISYTCDLDIRNCTFTKNQHAVHMSSPKSAYLENVSITDNTGWGILSYYKTANFKNVDVVGNKYGMYMYGVKDDLTANGLAVTDNQSHGIYFNRCDMKVAAKDAVKIDNNYYSLYSYNSNLDLDGFNLTSGKGYGLLAYYGNVSLKNASITNHSNGAYIYKPVSANLSNVSITGNRGWGMMTYGPNWRASDVTIAKNNYGLYLNGINDDQIDLTNVKVNDNKYHGVYGYKSQLYLNKKNFNQPGSRWQLANNGYGVTGYSSDVKIDGITMENSKYIGVLTYYSDVAVTDATVRNNGHGLYLYRNNKVTVDRTRLYNNTGWAVLKYGGDLSMRNSVVTRNNVGMYLYGYADTDSSNVWNTTIADNSSHGVYQANRGTGSIVNNIIANSRKSGYGFYTQAKINHSHNLVYGFGRNFVNTTPSSDDVEADPKFFDRANGNYTLNGFSPAVNRGLKMKGKVDADIIGYARPAFGRWELGAYEYTNKTDQVRVTSWKEERNAKP